MSTVELKIKEYEADISELRNLLNQATRNNVKQFLTSQLEKLENESNKLQKSEQERIAKLTNAPTTQTTGYTKKIDTYGWDQSDKFVKIYITSLNDVSKVKETDISSKFGSKSFDVTINNLNNINYNLTVNNLLYNIDPAQSYAKIKSGMVVIFLKKTEAKNWSCVTEKEMKSKEKATPKLDENADPQEGLMSMMKKMYDEGDDEMKRTISKAFIESREKSMKGDAGLDAGFGAGLGAGLDI